MTTVFTMQEVVKAMQGVELLILMVSTTPSFSDMMGRSFYRALMEENIMEECGHVVLRAVKPRDEGSRRTPAPKDLETLMKRYRVKIDTFVDNLCE